MSQDRNAIETRIHAAFEAQRYERAATLAIGHYGAEVFGFLRSQLRDEDAAREVFAQFSEVFWQTLPEFRWACSMRTWAYKLARSEAQRYRRRERKHHASRVTDASPLSNVVFRNRTTTAAYRRTAVKDRFQRLRESLRPDDQALLVLRVDRGLSWRELAEVMFEGAAADRDPEVEAARLRKRFQVLRARLRRIAESSGLLER
jgi:RNA polymerase sigma-70 factor (ECF subfamily)